MVQSHNSSGQTLPQITDGTIGPYSIAQIVERVRFHTTAGGQCTTRHGGDRPSRGEGWPLLEGASLTSTIRPSKQCSTQNGGGNSLLSSPERDGTELDGYSTISEMPRSHHLNIGIYRGRSDWHQCIWTCQSLNQLILMRTSPTPYGGSMSKGG